MVQTASASRESNPLSILTSPAGFKASKNHLMYAPGRPFSELKQRAVSSMMRGVLRS